ncbi:MAG: sugar ABC transporter permease [bacterium]|nr:sugar ABC transporter permease [bacterium]
MKMQTKSIKYDWYGYLFILPFFAVFILFSIYPVINTFITSLTNENLNSQAYNFVGIRNYIEELTSKRSLFWQSFLNTWIIWLPNIIAQLSLALFLAFVLTNRRLKIYGMGLFRAVYFFPNLVTVTSIAVLAYAILDWQHGMLNQFLFGTGPGASDRYIWWLNDPSRSRMIISVIQTWMWFGYTMILLMAGIQGIPKHIIEAAIVDGASETKLFRFIILPLLKPMLAYVIITSLIGGMNMFDMPWVITEGTGGADQSLMTMAVYMYSRAFRWGQLGSGSAVSFIMFFFTAIFSIIYLKVFNRNTPDA